MRIALFGGSFDPPHLAHTMAVLWALESGAVDRVLLVPVAYHPFGKSFGASFPHRLAMLTQAVRHLAPYTRISTIEAQREGPSYTIETLRLLQEESPDARWRLLVGSDIVEDLPRWYQGEELMRLAPPLIVPRMVEGKPSPPGALPQISSTDIRRRLVAGEETTGLLTEAVRQYIDRNQLYRKKEAQA